MPPKKKAAKPAAKKKAPARKAAPRRREAPAPEPVVAASPAEAQAPSPSGDSKAAWYMVSVYAACYAFLWLALLTDQWPREHYYHKVYALALFAVLPAALLVTAAVRLIRWALRGNQNLVPIIVASQTAFWGWFWTRPGTSMLTLPYTVTARTMPVKLLAGAAILALLSGTAPRALWLRMQRLALFAAPLLGVALLWHFTGDVYPERKTLFQLGAVAIGLTGLVAWGSTRPARSWDWVDYALGLAVILAIFSGGPYLDAYHMDCYLGPANEVLHGRSLLHEILCEYGVGDIYALALFFKLTGLKPLYAPFALLLMTLTAALYYLYYWLLRQSLRSRLLALLAIAVTYTLNRCGSFPQWDNLAYPSVGPLRFGLPVLMLWAGYQRMRGKGRAWGWLELAALGTASIWSLETAVHTLSAWCFFLGADLVASRRGWLGSLKELLLRGLQAGLAIGAAFAFLYLLTRYRAGAWPNWETYLIWMRLYAAGSVEWPLNPWGPWVVMPGSACLGLLAAALSIRDVKEADRLPAILMVGLIGAGAAQFSYYLNRPHPNNMGHVASLFILFYFYWIDRAWARKDWSGSLRWSGTAAALFVAAALVWNAQESLSGRFKQSMLSWSYSKALSILPGRDAVPFPAFFGQVREHQPLNGPHVRGATELINRFCQAQDRVAVFCFGSVEILAATGKGNAFAIGDLDEERWVRPQFDPFKDGAQPLKVGDIIIVASDKTGGYDGDPVLQDLNGKDMWNILNMVRARFKLVPVEPVPTGGVWALRLEPLDAATPAPAAAKR